MGERLCVALFVRGLQGRDCPYEVAIGEMVSAQVVQIGDALGGRVECQRRGLCVDAAEHLLRVAQLAALGEQFQA